MEVGHQGRGSSIYEGLVLYGSNVGGVKMAGDGEGCKGQRDLSTPGSCIPKWLSRCHQSMEGSWQVGSKAEHGDLDRRKGREMWRLQVQERTKAAEREELGEGIMGKTSSLQMN